MKLLLHSSLLSLSQLTEKVLSFVVIIVASRLLNADGVGEFFYYFSLVSLFLPIIDLGFDKLFLQSWYESSNSKRRETLAALLALKVLLALPALLAACLLDTVLQLHNPNPLAVTLCFAAVYLQGVGQLIRRPAFARGKLHPDIVIPIIEKGLCVLGVILFIDRFTSGWQIAYVYAGAHGIGAICSLAGLRGYSPSGWKKLQARQLVTLARAGIPFSLSTFFVMISLYFDSVMLGMISFEEVGLYGAAYRVIVVVMGLSGGTCRALFPGFASLRAEGRTVDAAKIFTSILRVHAMLFGTIAIGGVILGPRLMLTVYGENFAASGLAFQLLAPLVLLVSLTNVVGHALEAVGEQRQVMHITMRAAALNVISNLLLIPPLGMVGAAIATVLAEGAVLILQAHLLQRREDLPWRNRIFLRPVFFLIIIGVSYLPLRAIAQYLDQSVPLIASTIVSVCSGILIAAIIGFAGKRYWLDGVLTGRIGSAS